MPKLSSSSARIRFRVKPMLATLVPEPVNKTGWVYEEKYDGDRILAYKEGDRVLLLSRNQKDRTERFPGILAAVKALRARTLLLDGEVVVFDRKGVSRFQLLQQKGGDFVYSVFDCLFKDGKDLRGQSLAARRAALEGVIGASPALRVSRRLAANGLKAYDTAKRRGYEGLVAKDASSPYVQGRSGSWLKVKVHQEDEFIICGYTKPTGSRQHFGALLLGAYRGAQLRFVGKVGTGFDVATLTALWKRFQPLLRSRTALVNPPRDKGAVFIAPKLIAQISYQEWTSDQKLRQPVFLGLRDDKSAREVILPQVSV
jgi:bifunctional non-homologous end joining protein LigD